MLSIVAVYVLLSTIIPIILQKKGKVSKRVARMIIHFLSGFSILSLFFASKQVALFNGFLNHYLLDIFIKENHSLLNHFFNSINEKRRSSICRAFSLRVGIDYLVCIQ